MRLLLLLTGLAVSAFPGAERRVMGGGPADSLTTIVLARSVLDSMNRIFTQANEHWNELADLNWMERNLGTVRPTQREYLGCLLGEVRAALRGNYRAGACNSCRWVSPRLRNRRRRASPLICGQMHPG